MAEALLLSRAEESVRELYIKETIRRYMNAKLACDEVLLKDLVTDSSYIDIGDISTKTQYIEAYRNLQYIINECPYDVTEFRYIVYVAHDVKIINIATLAPGADELMIAIDENNYPKIFFGNISENSEAYRVESRKSSDFITLYEDVINRLAEAMISDANLREFIERINSATNQSESDEEDAEE